MEKRRNSINKTLEKEAKAAAARNSGAPHATSGWEIKEVLEQATSELLRVNIGTKKAGKMYKMV